MPSLRDIVIAAAVAVAFIAFAKLLEKQNYPIWLTIGAGILLIAGLTLIHGVDVGFYAPITGDAQTGVLVPISSNGQEYYHDALTVQDPLDFLERYNEIQPTLHRHTHTHPPGAVLTFYFLQRIIGDPAIIGLVLMLFAMIGTAFFFYRLMLTEFENGTAGFMSYVLLLLPAVQIYYLATIDALIAALLIGSLYLFCFAKGAKSVAGAAAMLCASFTLTFVSLFVLPVLIGFDLIVRKSIKRTAIVLGAVLAFHMVIYIVTGYDALTSFRTASLFENPEGFMLFTDPANYLFTRLEDIAEIMFFFGPFLFVLFVRAAKDIRLRPLDVLTVLGCVTLLGMFVSGAWRTGETARACVFIYPFLLFPIGRHLQGTGAGTNERLQLASLVFVQSLGMQMFGNYFW
jgi:hypothetical protein